MNHIFRIIWSEAIGIWIAVSELAKGHTKSASSRVKVVATSLLMSTAPAWALPSGEQVVAGEVSVSNPTVNHMQINQSSQNAVINWQGFSINPNEAVNINQPNAQSALLNRVIGVDASVLAGQLTSNGQVYLTNPNGVLFGAGSQVDVGALIATTHNLSNADFMNGNNHFTQNSATGTVENRGIIATPEGGMVALISSSVTNAGTVDTPKGTTVLAAGKTVDLDFQGNGLVQVQVTEAALKVQIINQGAILANGGRVVLTAKATGGLINTAINQSGVIHAQGLAERNGEILLAGGEYGITEISGTLDISGAQSGGNINVTGKDINVTETAKLSAKATESGTAGTIIVLADMASGTLKLAGELDASATGTADGGFIESSAANVNIADTAKVTTLASFGSTGTWLIDPTDFTVSAGSAAQSTSGMGATTLTNALASGSVAIATSAANTGAELGDININGAVSWSTNKLTLTAHNDININTVMTASGDSTLALTTGANKSVNVGMDANGFTGRLDFSNAAANALIINTAPYTIVNSLADLRGLAGAGVYALGSNIDASPTTVAGGSNTFTPIVAFTGTLNGLGHSIDDLYINLPTTTGVGLLGGNSTGHVSNLGFDNADITGNTYVGALAGVLAVTITAGTGNRSFTNNYSKNGNVTAVLAGGYAGGLVASAAMIGTATIDANFSNNFSSGSVNSSAYSGGVVGSIAITDGNFENNHSSANVMKYDPNGGAGSYLGGVVGSISVTDGNFSGNYASGTIGNFDNVASADTGSYSGGLVGSISVTAGDFINNCATGNVGGTSYIGGLVGSSAIVGVGDFKNNSATGDVKDDGSSGSYIGGLLGSGSIANGSFTNNSATGAVSGASYVGGLVGNSSTTGDFIVNYATGNVTDSSAAQTGTYIGGLVGYSTTVGTGRLFDSNYATGNVIGGGYVGGLVGDMSNAGAGNNTSNNYAAGNVSATSSYAGGFIGNAAAGAMTNNYSSGIVTSTVATLTGAFIGSRGAGAVSGNYWEQSAPQYGTTAPANSSFNNAAASAINSVDMLTSGSFAGFAFGNLATPNTWTMGASGPELEAFNVGRAATVTVGTVNKVYDGMAYSVSLPFSLVAPAETAQVKYFVTCTLCGASGNVTVTASAGGINVGDYGAFVLTGGSGVTLTGTNALTVTSAPLTVTANSVTKTYDGGLTTAGNGVVVTSGTLYTNAGNSTLDSLSGGNLAYTDKSASTGDKTVTVGGMTVNDGNNGLNYNIAYVSNTASTINAKALTVSGMTAATKIYDGNTSSTINVSGQTLTGLVFNDDVTVAATGVF
jgi:filamentous hemagglutinin family protein